MSHRISKSLLALALVGITATGYAIEPVTTAPITFDPQGTGGANGILLGGFDWAVNSILNEDAVPAPADGPTSFQAYFHSALQGATDPQGDPTGIPGLNTDFEITSIAGVKVRALVTGGTHIETQTICPDTDPPYTTLVCPDPVEDVGQNFLRFYIDDTIDSNALTGDGYADGTLMLSGQLVVVRSVDDVMFDPTPLLDEYNADDWGGTTTVTSDGAQQLFILVQEVNPDYFPDLKPGSLVHYTTETVLSYKEVNPSRALDTFDGTSTGTTSSDVGNINGINGPDFLEQVDPNNSFTPLQPGEACRVTGGGNDTSGITYDASGAQLAGWDGSSGSGAFVYTETVVKKVKGKYQTLEETLENDYTFGGQAGANTARQPQPKGELEHVQHSGPAGEWAFHMGTASAPPGTEVDIIQCSDPGWCRQARPAPDKQIDFAGIGSFRNIIDEGNLNDSGTCATVTDTHGNPHDRTLGTYNWAEVHIEDRGEPGREGQHTTADPANCPAEGTGTDAFSAYNGVGSRVDAVASGTYNSFVCKTDNDPSTGCPDFYRIRIYCGVEPTFDTDGNLSNFDEIAAQKANGPIYEVYGYIDGGNWQIHPLTGFDLHH